MAGIPHITRSSLPEPESFRDNAARRVAIAGTGSSDQFLAVLAEKIADQVADRVADKLRKPDGIQRVLLNVTEAALYLGRSKSAVQNLIYDRELPVVRNGRRVHLLRKDLDTWIEKHRT
jgi:excisionase family DNA binding protein